MRARLLEKLRLLRRRLRVWRLARGWWAPVQAHPLRPEDSLVARLRELRRS